MWECDYNFTTKTVWKYKILFWKVLGWLRNIVHILLKSNINTPGKFQCTIITHTKISTRNSHGWLTKQSSYSINIMCLFINDRRVGFSYKCWEVDMGCWLEKTEDWLRKTEVKWKISIQTIQISWITPTISSESGNDERKSFSNLEINLTSWRQDVTEE